MKTQQYIESLNGIKHRVGENAQWTLFHEPNMPTPDDDTPFWILSDIYNLCGAMFVDMTGDIRDDMWNAFDFATARKIINLPQQSLSQIFSQHVRFFDNNYTLNTPAGKIIKTNAPDAKISRYAFWSIMSKKFESAIGNMTRAYLINDRDDNARTITIAEQFARVHHRENMSRLEHATIGIANKCRLNPRQINAAMHRAFYNNIPVNDIKAAHHIAIRDRDPIANYMGTASLRVRSDGLARAIRMYDDRAGKVNFELVLTRGMYAARNEMIKTFHRAPERDIFRTPVSGAATRLNQLERDFLTRAINEHIK